jgi:transposase
MLPVNSAATPIRSPSGVGASDASAWPDCKTCHAPADRPLFPPEDRHKLLCLATTKPADVGLPTARWSLDDLAFHILRDAHYRDMSRSTIWRTLSDGQLRPHKSRYWLHSDDPEFESKVLDICRLYLDAPRLHQQGELVVCVDEKTGIQALERARPTSPARPGRDERRDHEYIRHGTCCLLASRVVATGQVIGTVTRQRGRWDFVRHLRDVVEHFPHVQRFHWVMDNLNTHWSFELCQYLGKVSGIWDERPMLRTGAERRAFLMDPSHKHVVHFTPKHGSWMNQIEIWFGVLSRRALHRGNFRSVEALTQCIEDFIRHYNLHDAYPYEWTYTGKPLTSSKREARRHRIRYGRRRLCVHRTTLTRRF